jgi:hypothetical protein
MSKLVSCNGTFILVEYTHRDSVVKDSELDSKVWKFEMRPAAPTSALKVMMHKFDSIGSEERGDTPTRERKDRFIGCRRFRGTLAVHSSGVLGILRGLAERPEL